MGVMRQVGRGGGGGEKEEEEEEDGYKMARRGGVYWRTEMQIQWRRLL